MKKQISTWAERIPTVPCQAHQTLHSPLAPEQPSMSSASSKATRVASSLSASLSSALPSASAAAAGQPTDASSQTSTQTLVITTIAITTTTLLAILAGIYYGGYADDILEGMAKKYYAAKAQAEATALAHTGSEKVQGVLKGTLFPPLSSRHLNLARALPRGNFDYKALHFPSARLPRSESALMQPDRIAEGQPRHGRGGTRAGEQRAGRGSRVRGRGRREREAGRWVGKGAVNRPVVGLARAGTRRTRMHASLYCTPSPCTAEKILQLGREHYFLIRTGTGEGLWRVFQLYVRQKRAAAYQGTGPMHLTWNGMYTTVRKNEPGGGLSILCGIPGP